MKTKIYKGFISCYNNAMAHFDFEADSFALAKDHIVHLINDREMLNGLDWNKYPGQIHYIRFKREGTVKDTYIYNMVKYNPIDYKEIGIEELLKFYLQHNPIS